MLGAAGTLLVVAAACGTRPAETVNDVSRGCRYTPPPGWRVFDGELRSRDSSLFTIRVFDLQQAERAFLDGLPESIVPQLEESARLYYVVEGGPERSPATIGGHPALELNWVVRVRAQDPEAKLTYWVVRHADRLFILRGSFTPRGAASDDPAVRRMLEGWTFLDAEAPAGVPVTVG